MSVSRFILVVALCAFAASRADAQATIEGRVELPKPRPAPVLTKRYDVIPPGGVLRAEPPRAIVYLEGAPAKPASLPKKQVLQKDLMFSPGVLAVQVGTTVEFPNGDPTYHNIFSYSPAKRFDLGRYRPEERPIPSQTFDTPGLVTLRCDIHDHMRGLILVLETPHFVTTDTDGRYRLSGIPPGKYKLKVWVDSKMAHERAVELKSGAPTRVDFP
jgi:plastocyanin